MKKLTCHKIDLVYLTYTCFQNLYHKKGLKKSKLWSYRYALVPPNMNLLMLVITKQYSCYKWFNTIYYAFEGAIITRIMYYDHYGTRIDAM